MNKKIIIVLFKLLYKKILLNSKICFEIRFQERTMSKPNRYSKFLSAEFQINVTSKHEGFLYVLTF